MSYLLDNDVFFAALYAGHAHHTSSRTWLDQTKSSGWNIAVETYLAAMRLLINPAIMGAQPLNGSLAQQVVRTELKGPFPGTILYAASEPKPEIFSLAIGHRQIMDFWLVQLAMEHNLKLATRDKGLLANWPEVTFKIP